MFKRFFSLLICLLIIFTSTFSVPVYAGIDDDQYYIPLRSENDLVKAFQAYCKSRDLTIEGSTADAITTFTTSTFNFFANSVGIDVTELQAEIKAQYDSSGAPIKFLYNTTGIGAMNRIFAQFLQDNELQVGDTNVNKLAYSGAIFTDKDGYSCLCYLLESGVVIAKGTDYKYSSLQYKNAFENGVIRYIANLTDNTTVNYYSVSQVSNQPVYRFNYGTGKYPFYSDNPSYGDNLRGSTTVFYEASNNYYYFGSYKTENGSDTISNNRWLRINMTDSESQGQNNITVNIVSQNINNNNYEGDTYITNEGDVINNNPEPTPGGNDPGWNIGGGQGSYNDGNGNSYTINFPDFELPDLNIDWSIQGLGNKFPFSIPFDIASLVSVLNAEPEAPRFQGTVNFGFTTWDYDINLEQFDTVAQVCRIAELLLLVFGLILITRSIIKG